MYRESLPLMIIALMFAIAVYAGPVVQTNELDQIIGHWGMTGRGDGMIDKTVGLYLLPVLSLIIYIGLMIVPKIEVYRKNLGEFEMQFWGFKVILVFVMGAIYVSTLLPSMGYWRSFDPLIIAIPAIALLFFYVGYMLNFTRRNYFIGVRTPWTLSSEKVWSKTNHLAGKLFWICGVLTLISLLAPGDLRLWLILLPIVIAAIGASAYSYFEYRKTRKSQDATMAKRKKKGRK